jgi:hypothetical protein
VSIPRLDEADFVRLRDAASVRKRLRFVTPEHWRACGCYLALLPVWALFAGYGGYAIERAGFKPGSWIVLTLLVLATLLPLLPLLRVRRHLRRPILDELAEQHKLDYASHDFELKAFEEARPMLFGETATSDLTDLLAGKEGGEQWAICHAEIEAGGEAAYSGLLYWLRAKGSNATIVLVPADAAASIKVPKKVVRRPFPNDPSFDAAFAVFASDAEQAQRLFDDDFRQLLLGHAGQGPVYLHLARNDTFFAARPPASFESTGDAALRGEARLRAIFDNFAAALNIARAVKAGTERA